MIPKPLSWRACAALSVVFLAACGPGPVAPEGATASLAPSPWAAPRDARLTLATAVSEPTWETYGLLWGRPPGTGGGGSDDVALRSSLSIATRAKGPPASAVRLWLPPGRNVAQLGTMSYRFLLEGGQCGAGSPRIAVYVDTDGDGTADTFPWGYAGPYYGYTGCPLGEWIQDVATDADPSWELNGVTGLTWQEVVEIITLQHPNHQVVRLQWIQDSFFAFSPLVTWVDDVSFEGMVLGSPGDLN